MQTQVGVRSSRMTVMRLKRWLHILCHFNYSPFSDIRFARNPLPSTYTDFQSNYMFPLHRYRHLTSSTAENMFLFQLKCNSTKRWTWLEKWRGGRGDVQFGESELSQTGSWFQHKSHCDVCACVFSKKNSETRSRSWMKKAYHYHQIILITCNNNTRKKGQAKRKRSRERKKTNVLREHMPTIYCLYLFSVYSLPTNLNVKVESQRSKTKIKEAVIDLGLALALVSIYYISSHRLNAFIYKRNDTA